MLSDAVAENAKNQKLMSTKTVKIEELELEITNCGINMDLTSQNLNTKVKLLEEALTRRNVDIE